MSLIIDYWDRVSKRAWKTFASKSNLRERLVWGLIQWLIALLILRATLPTGGEGQISEEWAWGRAATVALGGLLIIQFLCEVLRVPPLMEEENNETIGRLVKERRDLSEQLIAKESRVQTINSLNSFIARLGNLRGQIHTAEEAELKVEGWDSKSEQQFVAEIRDGKAKFPKMMKAMIDLSVEIRDFLAVHVPTRAETFTVFPAPTEYQFFGTSNPSQPTEWRRIYLGYIDLQTDRMKAILSLFET